MDIPLLIAKVLSLYFIVSGLLLIFRKKLFVAAVQDFFAHPGIVYVTGAFLFLSSSFLLLTHTAGKSGLPLFVTIVLWLWAIKGAVLIVIPEAYSKIHYERMYTIPIGLVVAAVGVWLLMTI